MESIPGDFNPRLRLDLDSGQRSLRGLNESVRRLAPIRAASARPAATAADDYAAMPPVVDYDKAIALMRGRHTKDMHEGIVSSLRKISALNARGFFLGDLKPAHELLSLAARAPRSRSSRPHTRCPSSSCSRRSRPLPQIALE